MMFCELVSKVIVVKTKENSGWKFEGKEYKEVREIPCYYNKSTVAGKTTEGLLFDEGFIVPLELVTHWRYRDEQVAG